MDTKQFDPRLQAHKQYWQNEATREFKALLAAEDEEGKREAWNRLQRAKLIQLSVIDEQ